MAQEREELHNIFTVDPFELQNFVDRYVEVVVNGNNFLGTVYTIDPVSQSLILIQNENKVLSMKIVLKHSINSINIISQVPQNYKFIKMKNLFSQEHMSSENNTKEMKEKVKLWLTRNMIPVVENGDILKVDSLEIHPPYGVDNCYCSNSIVLDRVQNLLKNIGDLVT